MPTILVVDDSAVDRRLVGSLLEADAELQIRYAADGAEALEQIDAQRPDLVVTDMQMPEMDGLELIKTVRRLYPAVPVVLTTQKGSELLAVEALKSGAASYVPKQHVAQHLLRTVRGVLELCAEGQELRRLMDRMSKSECAFVLDNDPALIPPLVRFLQAWLSLTGICFESERVRLGVALNEALLNALEHGNLEVGSHRHAKDGEAFRELTEQRRSEAPYCQRRIHVETSITPAAAAIVIRDEGDGFDTSTLPDADDPENVIEAGGRGVVLMRMLMDQVTYNDEGNQVTLVKLNDYKLDEVIMEEPAA